MEAKGLEAATDENRRGTIAEIVVCGTRLIRSWIKLEIVIHSALQKYNNVYL